MDELMMEMNSTETMAALTDTCSRMDDTTAETYARLDTKIIEFGMGLIAIDSKYSDACSSLEMKLSEKATAMDVAQQTGLLIDVCSAMSDRLSTLESKIAESASVNSDNEGTTINDPENEVADTIVPDAPADDEVDSAVDYGKIGPENDNYSAIKHSGGQSETKSTAKLVSISADFDMECSDDSSDIDPDHIGQFNFIHLGTANHFDKTSSATIGPEVDPGEVSDGGTLTDSAELVVDGTVAKADPALVGTQVWHGNAAQMGANSRAAED